MIDCVILFLSVIIRVYADPKTFAECVGDKFNITTKENGPVNLLKTDDDKVTVKWYYEVFCARCRNFELESLLPSIANLGDHVILQPVPFGKANSSTVNGHVEFTCQHGPTECYGNKLHACAIHVLSNPRQAVVFNACLMDPCQEEMGSDDKALEKCGNLLHIDAQAIKDCAKGEKGSELLLSHEEETMKARLKEVPQVLVNGVIHGFQRDVCRAFKDPPVECSYIYN